jgi:hypothetical protein
MFVYQCLRRCTLALAQKRAQSLLRTFRHVSPRDARDRGPSCCAAFALGTNGGKRCPATYGLLITADACKSAADAASKTYAGTVAYSFYPSGCYWHTINGSVYYNSNVAGAANFYAQPLCAGAALTHTLAWTDTALAPRTLGRRAGAAATAPTFSPAGGMPYCQPHSLRSCCALCGFRVGSTCDSRSRR